MEKEILSVLSELQKEVGIIGERTQAIRDGQDDLKNALITHEEQNRNEFATVHGRINKAEVKQSWIVGIGTAFFIGLAVFGDAVIKLFGG